MNKKTISDSKKVIKILNKIFEPENFHFVLVHDLECGYAFIELHVSYSVLTIGMKLTYVMSFYVDDQFDVFKALFGKSISSFSGYTSIIELRDASLFDEDEIHFYDVCERLGVFSLADVSSLDELKLKLQIMGLLKR